MRSTTDRHIGMGSTLAGVALASLFVGTALAEETRPAAFVPGAPVMQRPPVPAHPMALPPEASIPLIEAMRPGPQVGRYFSADGSVGFVLDFHSGLPLLRFDHSPEVLVLRSVPAPRGDLVLKTAEGRTVLRLTPYGALTVFAGDATGVPVLRTGGSGTLFSSPPSAQAIAATAQRLTLELSERLGVPVAVRVMGSEALRDEERVIVHQALENCGVAFREMSRRPLTRQAIAGVVRGIRIEPAASPALVLEDGELRVHVAAALAARGWSSSAAIQSYLLGAL